MPRTVVASRRTRLESLDLEEAVAVSVAVVRAFVRLRTTIAANMKELGHGA